MTIPTVTPYTGDIANPDGSQTQTEFTQNMFDQLSYEAELSTELNSTVDGINDTAIQVDSDATSAAQSAASAEAAASGLNYQGLWPDTGGSANKGDTYQTQVSGTPTGQYFTALQDTTVDPVGDDVNWRGVITPTGDGSQLSVVAAGSDTPRTLGDRFAEKVYGKDWGLIGGILNSSSDTAIAQQMIDHAYTNNKELDFQNIPIYINSRIHVWTGLTVKNLNIYRNMYQQDMVDFQYSSLLWTYGNIDFYNLNLDDRNSDAVPPIAVFPDETTPNQTAYVAVNVDYRSGLINAGPSGIVTERQENEWTTFYGGTFENGCGTFVGGGKSRRIRTFNVEWGQYNDHCIYISNTNPVDADKGLVTVSGGRVKYPDGSRKNTAFKFRGGNLNSLSINGLDCDIDDSLVALDGDQSGEMTANINNCVGRVGKIFSSSSTTSTDNIEINVNFSNLIIDTYLLTVGGFNVKSTTPTNVNLNFNNFVGGQSGALFGNDGSLSLNSTNISGFNGFYVDDKTGGISFIGGSYSNCDQLLLSSASYPITTQSSKSLVIKNINMIGTSSRLIFDNVNDGRNPILYSHNITVEKCNLDGQAIYAFGSGIDDYAGSNKISFDATYPNSSSLSPISKPNLFKPIMVGNGSLLASGTITSLGLIQSSRGFNVSSSSVNLNTYTVNFATQPPSARYGVIVTPTPISIVKRVDGFDVAFSSATEFDFTVSP